MERVMAVNTRALRGFMPLGALQAGLVARPQAAALSSALLCAVLATVALVALPSFRRLS